MNIDFVQEIVEDERIPYIIGCLTGWEAIVFEMEDEADDEVRKSDCALRG